MIYILKNNERSNASMKMIKPLTILLAIVSIGMSTPTLFGKGTTWDMEFDQPADGNGGQITIGITLDNGGYVSAIATIPANATPAQKAAAIASALDANPRLKAHVSGGTVIKIAVQDDWAGDNTITAIDFVDVGTGERLHRAKDDPADIIVNVKVDISGTGSNRYDGDIAKAVLGIGIMDNTDGLVPLSAIEDTNYPLASVETLDKSGEQIESELADAFNVLFNPDYTAVVEDGFLVVVGVPCELGTIFGTDDDGLTYGLTMTQVDNGVRPIPTVSQWGLIVMTGLVLAAGAMVIYWRKQRIAM